MIDEILNVAKGLWSIKKSLSKAKGERREKLAKYFEQISNCLEEAAKVLRTGAIPHGKCGEMRGYAEMFTKTVKGIISEQETEKFAKQLDAARDIEYAVYEMEKRDRDSQLGKLEEASGLFQALANSIRVG